MKPEERIMRYLLSLKQQETPQIYWGNDKRLDDYTRGRLRGRIEALEFALVDNDYSPLDTIDFVRSNLENITIRRWKHGI